MCGGPVGLGIICLMPGEDEIEIIEINFASAEGELGVFSDLPLVTRSELIRSLRTLDGGGR
jgi:hypothetical protein